MAGDKVMLLKKDPSPESNRIKSMSVIKADVKNE